MEVFINNIRDSYSPVGFSQLGNVVHDNVVFPGLSTPIGLPSGAIVTVDQYPTVRLDAVSLTNNRPKNIVISQIAGRQGNQKEYTGVGDQVITVTATISPRALTAADIAAIAAGQANQLAGNVASQILAPARTIAGAVSFTPYNQDDELLTALVSLDNYQGNVEVESKYINNILGVRKVVVEDMRLEFQQAGTWILSMTLLSDDEIDLGGFG